MQSRYEETRHGRERRRVRERSSKRMTDREGRGEEQGDHVRVNPRRGKRGWVDDARDGREGEGMLK